MEVGRGSLVWRDVEDAVYPEGWAPGVAWLRAGAVGLAGNETATEAVRRDAALLRHWGEIFPSLRAVALPKTVGKLPDSLTAFEMVSPAASAVNLTNHGTETFEDDVRVAEPETKRTIVIPNVTVPPGESLWLPLSVSLAPAICIARDGFKPDPRLLASIKGEQKDLERWPASAAKFLPGGQPPVAGEVWRDPDQARTWELIAAKGDAGFYHGEVAQKLVDAVRAAGGNWTLQDLANYRAKERTPITVDYQGYRIVTAPPPSSGGVAIAEILNILRGYDLAKMDPAHRVHIIVEAMRRVHRDRAVYMGDPDFVDVPVAEEVIIACTVPVANACGTSGTWITVGLAPSSSARRAV